MWGRTEFATLPSIVGGVLWIAGVKDLHGQVLVPDPVAHGFTGGATPLLQSQPIGKLNI